MRDVKKAIYFDSNIWSSSPKVDRAVAFLSEQIKALGERKRWHTQYAEHIKLIILNLYNVHVHAPACSVSYWRTKNIYSETQYYNATLLRHRAMIMVISALDEKHLGYLNAENVGYFIPKRDENGERTDVPEKSMISRMRPTPKLIRLLTKVFEFTPKVLERHPDEKLIILKTKIKEVVRLPGGKKATRTVTKKLPIEETAEIVQMRHNLRTINETIDRHFVGLCTNDKSIAELRERLLNNKNDNGEDYPLVLDFSQQKLRRIFSNGTFEDGGRFYGGWWQWLPSKDDPNPKKGRPKKNFRSYVRIDNMITVERDFSGMVVCMLYAEEKLPIPNPEKDDVYTLEGFSKETRPVVKKMLQIILNTDNAIDAIKAMQKHCPKEDYPEVFDKYSYEDIIVAFEKKHRKIAHHFYTRCGLGFQKRDSQIAESVMLKLAEKDMPVLCVHDSFIVRRDHEEELIEAMNSAVFDMYGTKFYDKADKTAYDIDYDFLYDNLEPEDRFSVEKYETVWTSKAKCFEYFARLYEWEKERGIKLAT